MRPYHIRIKSQVYEITRVKTQVDAVCQVHSGYLDLQQDFYSLRAVEMLSIFQA